MIGEQRISAVQVKAQVSLDELLKGVEQLNLFELEHFVLRVIALQAQRKSPSLPKIEAELLLKINRGLPFDTQKRYDELVAKRKAGMLTADEHEELLRLIAQVENSDAERVKYMVDLACLRGTCLTVLMKDLGIRPPAYA
jgi:hypothetical protein